MKKNISKYVKIILMYICIVHVLIGCNDNYISTNNLKLRTQADVTNYIAENFSEYNGRIKDESRFEGKIVSDKKNQKEQRYIEFCINDDTKIRFESNNVGISIIKDFSQSNEPKDKKELEIYLIGIDNDAKVHISLETQYGYIVSEYKADDLEHPILSQKEKEENYNLKIKSNISTEEIEELIAKARSIYSVFEEIADEYNENLEADKE